MDLTGIKKMAFDRKSMTMEEAFRSAVIEARASNKYLHFRTTEYQVVYRVYTDTDKHPFGTYEAHEAERAVIRGDFDSIRDCVEEWVEDAYSNERDEATAEGISLLRGFCDRHKELTIEGYTGEDEDEQDENIDNEVRDMGIEYPDYQDIFEAHSDYSYDWDGEDEDE